VPRVPLDGITLAVGEWRGPDTADRTAIAVHGLTANHDTVLLGEAPEPTAAPPALLAGE
jgi:hypothetical protein